MDIVETGTTLRENQPAVIDTVAQLSARLIANKASYAFKREKITALMAALEEGNA